MAQVARLFGRLLLRELDAQGWQELSRPELGEALAALGILLPSGQPEVELERLAVEFFEAFIQPESGGPLVQSLWTEGSYEGEAAVALRKLGEAAGLEQDREAARGAAPDHLGCILLLWAKTQETRPDVAARLERDHLAWATRPLGQLARGEGFYAAVARATGSLLAEIGVGVPR